MNGICLAAGLAGFAAILFAGPGSAAGAGSELEPNSCSIACSPDETAYPGMSASVTCSEGSAPVCQCGDPLQKMAYCQPISATLAGMTRARQTIQHIRAVGTAMYAWRLDQSEGLECDPAPRTIDLADIPPIEVTELERLLVPTYIAELPLTDGWDYDLEFRLDRSLPKCRAMSIRSAGADSVYSGSVYTLGGFPSTELDQDVVWFDGYFGRWPEKP